MDSLCSGSAGDGTAGPAGGTTVRKEQAVSGSDLKWIISCHSQRLVQRYRTAENEDAVTPLPHENVPLEIPQLPFDVVKVKLELVPDRV